VTAGPQATTPQWSWLWPSGLGLGAFVSGILLAVSFTPNLLDLGGEVAG
jgi:uncharacterized integral membrane protein